MYRKIVWTLVLYFIGWLMMRAVRIRVLWCVRTARPWKVKLNGQTNRGNSVLEIVKRTALLIMELMLMAISRVKEFLCCVRRKLAVLKLWVQLFCPCIYFSAFELCCLLRFVHVSVTFDTALPKVGFVLHLRLYV